MRAHAAAVVPEGFRLKGIVPDAAGIDGTAAVQLPMAKDLGVALLDVPLKRMVVEYMERGKSKRVVSYRYWYDPGRDAVLIECVLAPEIGGKE